MYCRKCVGEQKYERPTLSHLHPITFPSYLFTASRSHPVLSDSFPVQMAITFYIYRILFPFHKIIIILSPIPNNAHSSFYFHLFCDRVILIL